MKNKRVFVSLPADVWLTADENKTKWAIVKAIERLGYDTELFLDPRRTASRAGPLAWSARACEDVMRRCMGCVLLGFARWRLRDRRVGDTNLATEYNHYEGAVAHTLRLPMLVLVQEGVRRRVVFDDSYRGHVGVIPMTPMPQWLRTREFKRPFDHWHNELRRRRDVFLGYCSASSKVAGSVKALLKKLGFSVLDWALDFLPANTILNRIEDAASRCGAGVFLFTQDDALVSPKRGERAAPRDNVVLEAGYFIASKGKERVLIVREEKAKMPADLGGDIYASFTSRAKVAADIGPTLRRFLASL